jgi:hypothetical protein
MENDSSPDVNPSPTKSRPTAGYKDRVSAPAKRALAKGEGVKGVVHPVPLQPNQFVHMFTRTIPSQIVLTVYNTLLRIFDDKGNQFGTDVTVFEGQANDPIFGFVSIEGQTGTDAHVKTTYLFVGPEHGTVQVWDWIAEQNGWWHSNSFVF